MKMKQPLIAVLLFGLIAGGAALLWASGPAGCYAIVDKIILEPNDSAPNRIQVWGLFSVADGKTGNAYLAPQAGYMYFKLQEGMEKPTLAEWADLKKVAGTETVIAFAQRYEWNERLRKPADKVEFPDMYPVYNGITRVVNGQGLGSIENPGVAAQLLAAHKKKT
jgi:hypothetical protein